MNHTLMTSPLRNCQWLIGRSRVAVVCFTLGAVALIAGGKPCWATESDQWVLLWQDEFDGKELDTTRWRAMQGNPWQAANVRVADGCLFLKASLQGDRRLGAEVRTGKSHGEIFSLCEIRPPVRIEIRFKPIMKPGSFIALWLMHTRWNTKLFAQHNIQVGKEFDLLECAGGENIVTESDIQIKAHMTVHTWRAPMPWVPQGQRSVQVNTAPMISVGNPVTWQEIRFDWDDESRPGGCELRYYWRSDGEDWGEPRLRLRPEPEFFPKDHPMNRIAFDQVRHVDILRAVWEEPMHIILWNQARDAEAWISQEQLASRGFNTWGGSRLNPNDFPVEVPIDFIRVFVPSGDPRVTR